MEAPKIPRELGEMLEFLRYGSMFRRRTVEAFEMYASRAGIEMIKREQKT
jgi:hypothetical protein